MSDDFVLHDFPNFRAYREAQNRANAKGLMNIWVDKGNIRILSIYIMRNMEPDFGLCHGTRRGNEQRWFKEFLKCDVLGTEIADTAEQFPATIQWDFHDAKPEWIGSVDFIYSNSFDHSHSPKECLATWVSCLKPKGLCFIEHSKPGHGPNKTSESDAFGAHLNMMPGIIDGWGEGKYRVKEMLDAPSLRPGMKDLKFIVVEPV